MHNEKERDREGEWHTRTNGSGVCDAAAGSAVVLGDKSVVVLGDKDSEVAVEDGVWVIVTLETTPGRTVTTLDGWTPGRDVAMVTVTEPVVRERLMSGVGVGDGEEGEDWAATARRRARRRRRWAGEGAMAGELEEAGLKRTGTVSR